MSSNDVPPRMCAHSTFSNPTFANTDFFDDYLRGLTAPECFHGRLAALVAAFQLSSPRHHGPPLDSSIHGLQEYRNPNLRKVQTMLLADIEDHYRLFHYVAPHLHNPPLFLSLCPAPLSPDAKHCFIHVYYTLDPAVSLKMFGGGCSEVEDVASATRRPQRSVAKQVDNVKRVHKALTASLLLHDYAPLVVEAQFLLAPSVALQYAWLSFSMAHGIETNHPRVATLSWDNLIDVVSGLHGFCERSSMYVSDAFYSQLAEFRGHWRGKEAALPAVALGVLKIASLLSNKKSLKLWLTEVAEKLGPVSAEEVRGAVLALRTGYKGLVIRDESFVRTVMGSAADAFLLAIVGTHSVLGGTA